MIRHAALVSLALLAGLTSGCGWLIRTAAEAEERGDKAIGITFYVGGAGPIGNIGSWDVPAGLSEGGYEGYIRVFQWQGLTHAGDQLNLSRNLSKASELAAEIRAYRRRFPGRPINMIALSAGTGIAVFALGYLPEDVQLDRVVLLSSSLSARYDLTRALRRVKRAMYSLYSVDDLVLRELVSVTGTVDRSSASDGIAGLEGFHPPIPGGPDTLRQYRKLHNIAYRAEFADVGYKGQHADAVSRDFIRAYIAPVILGKDQVLLPQGKAGRKPAPSTAPSGKASSGAGGKGSARPKPSTAAKPRKESP